MNTDQKPDPVADTDDQESKTPSKRPKDAPPSLDEGDPASTDDGSGTSETD